MSKWISVKDRLPEIGDDSPLVYPRKYHTTATYNHCGDLNGKWTVDDANGYEYEVDVTHWMPLPEPPTEEDINE